MASAQMSLLAPSLPDLSGEDHGIRCCDVRDLLPSVSGAQLVIADSPWDYTNTGAAGSEFNGTAKSHFNGLPPAEIADILRRCADSCAPDAYLLCWVTFPLLWEWMAASMAPGALGDWRPLTGGAWLKTTGMGVGTHVRGDAELWLVYRKGNPKPRGTLRNGWGSPRTRHSAKPPTETAEAIRNFSDPGGLVLCPFVGLGVDAVAAHLTGRRFIGAEIDPKRCAKARRWVAMVKASGMRNATPQRHAVAGGVRAG